MFVIFLFIIKYVSNTLFFCLNKLLYSFRKKIIKHCILKKALSCITLNGLVYFVEKIIHCCQFLIFVNLNKIILHQEMLFIMKSNECHRRRRHIFKQRYEIYFLNDSTFFVYSYSQVKTFAAGY